MIYQVNARSLKPYYTESYLDALHIYHQLKQFGPPCTLRTLPAAKAIYKALYK